MSVPRIYLQNDLKTNALVRLTLEASHHVINVLRMKVGNSVILFNNRDGEFAAKLTSIEKNQVIVEVQTFLNIDRESPLYIHLGQGIARGEKMDFIIQKTVELGVAKITPLFTEFCNVKLAADRIEKKVKHWQAIAISACEQCGRTCIPEIATPQNLTTWLQNRDETLKLVLDATENKTLSTLKEIPTKLSILIGPEGGLSETELQLAQRNKFQALKLGPRILRTETAGLAAIAILQSRWGDMS